VRTIFEWLGEWRANEAHWRVREVNAIAAAHVHGRPTHLRVGFAQRSPVARPFRPHRRRLNVSSFPERWSR
jgi:hypothetical protein